MVLDPSSPPLLVRFHKSQQLWLYITLQYIYIELTFENFELSIENKCSSVWLDKIQKSQLYSRITYGVAIIRLLQIVEVSFAEYLLFYRALLQKSRIILRSLLIVATPGIL